LASWSIANLFFICLFFPCFFFLQILLNIFWLMLPHGFCN
jgi:hypothetical protein